MVLWIRSAEAIEREMPSALQPLYEAVTANEGLILEKNYELTNHLVNWGSSSLVFLGKLFH